jgi:predicted DNA-binding helix-hairpin-helix protein
MDDLKHLSLFKLTRYKYNLMHEYHHNWLYYAAFSPLWMNRLKQFKGYPDFMRKQVIFIDEDLEQEFYDNYGYEPDEQPKNTQNKNIMEIQQDKNWNWFYKTYKNAGLVSVYEEELEAFDEDKLVY